MSPSPPLSWIVSHIPFPKMSTWVCVSASRRFSVVVVVWPVNGFVTDNDFTGKIVIPFCTSGSSGLEDSGTKLRDMAGTGTWLEGQRFSGRASQADVESWVNGLDLTAYQADSNGVNQQNTV